MFFVNIIIILEKKKIWPYNRKMPRRCSNFGNPYLNGLPSFPNFQNFAPTTKYGPMLQNGMLVLNLPR